MFWCVGSCDDAHFPFRIRIVQGDRTLLALRAKEKWPGPGGQIFCLREEEGADEPAWVERVPVVSCKRYGRKLSVVLDRSRNKRCEFLFLSKRYKNKPGEYEQIFFRTQSGIAAHKSRGRVQLFGRAPISVVIDSGERYPWKFAGAEVSRRRLPVGDYALSVREHLAAVVERKTFANLLKDFTRIQVLHQQLSELSAYPHAALVIEAQYADFLDPKKTDRWPAAHTARVLAEIAALHPHVQLIFAGNRKMGNAWTHGFFAAVAAKLADRPPDVVAEAAAAYRTPASGGLDARIRQAVLFELPERFTIARLRAVVPEADDARLRRLLSAMREEGLLVREGRGRGARWRRC